MGLAKDVTLPFLRLAQLEEVIPRLDQLMLSQLLSAPLKDPLDVHVELEVLLKVLHVLFAQNKQMGWFDLDLSSFQSGGQFTRQS